NNVATAIVNAKFAADVSLSGAVSPEPVELLHPVTYTWLVTNRGPNLATAVQVTDALPDGLAFSSATPSQGSCANVAGTIVCDLGSLASGASASVTVVGVPNRAGVFTNSAAVTIAQIDPNPADNIASQLGTVVV